jgi:PTS system ascorbate-specific IIA component
MIDGFTLTKDLIQFADSFQSWEEALVTSSEKLLELKYIEKTYVDAIIQSVKDYGPYIVIAPNIAMPHARPEAGANKVGFSVMVCKEPVVFDETTQARLFVTLSCVDSDTHLQMMQALVTVLGDDAKVEQLLNTDSKDIVLEMFK